MSGLRDSYLQETYRGVEIFRHASGTQRGNRKRVAYIANINGSWARRRSVKSMKNRIDKDLGPLKPNKDASG
jgi:hypothetical protein